MESLYLYFALSSAFNAITSTFLGLFVFFKNTKAKINQIFGLFCLSVSVWAWPYVLWPLAKNAADTLFWFRVLHIGAIFVSITYLHFIVTWLGIYQKKKKVIIFGYLLAVFFLLFVFSPLFIKDMVPKFSMRYWGEPGILYYFYLLMFFGFGIYSLYLLSVDYQNATGTKKSQIKCIFTGMVIAYMGGSTNYLLFFNINFPPYGNILASAYVIFTAYAIVKNQLFGIKVVITQALVAVISILLFVNFFSSKSLFEYIWKGALFAAFLAFGWLLVRSVKKEIEQKEKLDKAAWELSKVNAKLEGANEKLKKLDKAKSEFISIASHQLRTPLSAIKGYVSMFLEGDYGVIPKPLKTPLDNVYNSNQRLINLVNSLLNLSRLEAGRIVIEKMSFSIEKLISDLIKGFKTHLRSDNIILEFKKPKIKLPDIYADKAKITEVISNLLDNAIKYTPKGSITAKLDYDKANKKVLITVTDTGAGMTKQEMSKLFKSFSRAGAGSKHWTEGTGLGLYVAKKFITMQGGKIWAESPGKNKGSTFFIELPVK